MKLIKILFGIFLRLIVFPLALLSGASHLFFIGWIIMGPIYWIFTRRSSWDDTFFLTTYCVNYKY